MKINIYMLPINKSPKKYNKIKHGILNLSIKHAILSYKFLVTTFFFLFGTCETFYWIFIKWHGSSSHKKKVFLMKFYLKYFILFRCFREQTSMKNEDQHCVWHTKDTIKEDFVRQASKRNRTLKLIWYSYLIVDGKMKTRK